MLVYPAPATDAPPLPRSGESNASGDDSARGEDDFAGLRDFQRGDSPRRIAWKAVARSGELTAKRFDGATHAPLELTIGATRTADIERALGILARWVVDADAAGVSWSLALGPSVTGPSSGSAHRERCLAELALYEQEDPGDR